MNTNELIRFGVAWGPTIIFVLVLVCHFLVGLRRGQRKSLILAIQSFVIFMSCFTLFVFLVNNEKIDELTFKAINKMLVPLNTSLESILNISDVNSLKDVILKILPDIIGYGSIIEALFTNNAAYINTLVSLIYHLFFALLCYLLYIIVDFLAYLIYLIFYNNRKYQRKCNMLYRNNALESYVNKNRLGGGCIGLVKGLVSGIIIMSFIGSLFFIVGGDGTKENQEVTFGDSRIDLAYTAYDALGSYANTGILKVLNNIKNDNDVPYYLFAFDLVFSGKYKDEQNNINGNFILRDEIGAYVNLTRETFDLLLKYDNNNELKKLLVGNSNQALDVILLEIFQNQHFSAELRDVINRFEAKTYLINLTLGLVNSILVNIDQTNIGLDNQTKALVSVLFKGENAIKVNDLVNRNDIKVILNLLLDIMSYNGDVDDPRYMVEMINVVLPSIKKLNLYTDRELYVKLNPLLTECYGLILENTFSDIYNPEGIKMAVREASKVKIDWFKEFHLIVDNFDELYYFYNDIYAKAFTDYPELSFVNFLLDYVGSNDEYLLLTKNLLKIISDSQAIGYFVEYSTIPANIINSLPKDFRDNVPTKLSLTNKYDENGNLVEVGEMLSLFGALLDAAGNPSVKEAFIKLLNFDSSTSDLNELASIFNQFDLNFFERLSHSKLLNYAMTGLLTNMKLVDNVSIYIPDTVINADFIEGDDKAYKRIRREVFADTLYKVPSVIRLVSKYFSDGFTPEVFDGILNDDEFQNTIFTNDIFEATIANILISSLSNVKGVILVDSLTRPEAWLKGNGEIKAILDAIKATNIKMSDLLNGNLDLSMITNWNINEYTINLLFDSKFLYTNISNAVTGVEQIVVPYNSCMQYNETVNGEVFRVINKGELEDLIVMIPSIYDAKNNQLNIEYIIDNTDYYLKEPTLEATFTYIVGDTLIKNPNIEVEAIYVNSCNKESIANDYNNPWMLNKEAKNLVLACKTFFGKISLDMFNDFNQDLLKASLMSVDEIINDNSNPFNGKEKIYAIMASNIIKYNVSNILETILTDDVLSLKYKEILKVNNYYQEEDLLSFIRVLKYNFGQTLDDINISNIENLVFNRQKELFNAYAISNLLRGIVSTQLTTAFSGYLDPNIFECREACDDSGYISDGEIYYLLSTLSVLNIYKFSDLKNLNFSDNKILNTISFNIYNISMSYILRALITKGIDDILLNNPVIKPVDEAKELIGNNVYLYKTDELLNLLTILIDFEGSLNNMDIKALHISKLKSYNNSTIFRSALTDLFVTAQFVIPTNSQNNGIMTIDAVEKMYNTGNVFNLSTIIELLNICNMNYTNNMYLELITNDIFKYTFTKQKHALGQLLFTMDTVDVTTDMNANVIYGINSEEAFNLYLALNDRNLIEFDFIDVYSGHVNTSQLVRNTITDRIIKANKNKRLLVDNNYVNEVTTIDQETFYALNANEISNLKIALKEINSVNTLTSFVINIDINNLKNIDGYFLGKVFNSNLIHQMINDKYYDLFISEGATLQTECALRDINDKTLNNYKVINENIIIKILTKGQ